MAAFTVNLWIAGGLAASSQAPVPRVEAIASARYPPAGQKTAAHKPSYSFAVKGSGWADTGMDVVAGEQATVSATGKVILGDNRVAGPDGLSRGWKDLVRQYPLNSAPAGALIGRVTDNAASVPFLVGTAGNVTMPTTGRLYLAVNAPADLEGRGEFKVTWKFVKVDTGATAAVLAAPQPDVSTALTPETFAGMPRRVADQQGDPGDMVNFALLGTQDQVESAFKAAGWVAVDKDVEGALLHGLLSTLNHEAYTEMPMSTLFLFGRAQDLSFARADPLEVAARRHHLRVWKTDQTVGGKPLWVGSATHDVGFERDQRNPKAITHKIDPEIDLERQFLLESFDAAGMFSSAAYVTPADPLREARTATGGGFHSDGRILVMALR